MTEKKIITGFSKLSRLEKIKVISGFLDDSDDFQKLLNEHLHANEETQKHYNNISENTISNYFLPYTIAPNFLINNELFHVPMVTEESSVVAAAASAAKFWSVQGGFSVEISEMIKLGQIHFEFEGSAEVLEDLLRSNKQKIIDSLTPITAKMQQRGGGILDIKLLNKTQLLDNYFQLVVSFRTADSMGANFINTCLEELSQLWGALIQQNISHETRYEHIMSILTNYTPDCFAEVSVTCELSAFDTMYKGLTGKEFAYRFKKALDIARVDPYRAVTHNKGIYNGIDAVVLATGNDFRAVEACGHAFAANSGVYRSLSEVEIKNNQFTLHAKIPMALGTVGGLTQLHPLAKYSLKLLGNPSAGKLMQIVVSVGLASNFSAVRSLVTSGIQKGHMKMHLVNILVGFNASETEIDKAQSFFMDKTVSTSEVERFLNSLRSDHDATFL